MSYLKLRRTQEIGVEVNAECQDCGMPLLSEAAQVANIAPLATGARIVVKVKPCARCARERLEIAGASIHREGRTS